MKKLFILIVLVCFISCDSDTGTGNKDYTKIYEFIGILSIDDWNDDYSVWILCFTKKENTKNFTVDVFVGVHARWYEPRDWNFWIDGKDVYIFIYSSDENPVVRDGMNYIIKFITSEY